MKQSIIYALPLLGVASARTVNFYNFQKREVPQEHAHRNVNLEINKLLELNNPDNIQDAVFGLLGAKAAAEGAGNIADADCLQQAAADQAFTNAKEAGDVDGMTFALIYRALERNSGSIGLASPPCESIQAVNPEIAALQQHQDPAGDGAQDLNKQIASELAFQIASIGGDPLQANEAGTFEPGELDDATAKGNTCDDDQDDNGCINTLGLKVDDLSEDEILAAAQGDGAGAGVAAGAGAGNASAADAAGAEANQAGADAEANQAGADANANEAQGNAAQGKADANANADEAQADAKNADAQGNDAQDKADANANEAQGDAAQAGADANADEAQADAKNADAQENAAQDKADANANANANANEAQADAKDADAQGNDAQDKADANANEAQGDAAQAGADANANQAAAGAGAADFGSCADPTIVFGIPSDGRNEDAFEAADLTNFAHGSALNIGVISGFICDQLTNKCDANQAAVDQCDAADAAASGLKGQAAADAFNQALGF